MRQEIHEFWHNNDYYMAIIQQGKLREMYKETDDFDMVELTEEAEIEEVKSGLRKSLSVWIGVFL
jgi:hypothetical protein